MKKITAVKGTSAPAISAMVNKAGIKQTTVQNLDDHVGIITFFPLEVQRLLDSKGYGYEAKLKKSPEMVFHVYKRTC